MVVDTIVYHPTLKKLIKYLDTTAGREKSFRLVQYLVRFLAFHAATRGSSELAKLFKALQGHAAFIRKGLRFLKPLNHVQDAAKAFDNKLSDSIIRSTVVLKNLAYVGYLSLDSIAWFKLAGLVSNKTFPKAPKYANWFWFVGLVAGLVNDLRKISVTSSKLQSLDEKDSEKSKAIELENYKATKRLVWDSFDFFIVLNNLKFLNYDEGAVGLAGTITSIFGVQDTWNNTKI
ncbi:Peroxisomal membrane protein 11B [Wickerhamomyces ciferrii]|uniref:Peroxisomal membrane protein 11B n=1 Tax=Wickerhamomyces ciferrii (strain ATCC 14091 / BCRC 22168 / CBS 111 / JCM 3599 / NBRC 0793 / NRRL Y-1031 F-60-10) TaxID=1206466 RepID=K0KC70_WICCF|nr:Peroxisomal membrane protein 11B [Wickerhamomyces ciferrii]CCH42675.1 Peroxisomal membrane protein 11B [Wickerhamomyces ciferrii]